MINMIMITHDDEGSGEAFHDDELIKECSTKLIFSISLSGANKYVLLDG